MATVLDITSKLQKEEKVLKIGEQEFHIDDTKNTVMKAMAAIESTEGSGTAGFSAIDKALEILHANGEPEAYRLGVIAEGEGVELC